jgi:hypothetical protein
MDQLRPKDVEITFQLAHMLLNLSLGVGSLVGLETEV